MQEGIKNLEKPTRGYRENPRHPLRLNFESARYGFSLSNAAAEGPDVRQRHVGFRQGTANEASTRKRDRCTRENVSLEVGIRLRRGRLRPPDDVARLRAANQVHREAGASESAGDLERPARGRRP